MTEILDNLDQEHNGNPQQRHGCVTAWLILMLVANTFSAISYFFMGEVIAENLPSKPSTAIILALGALSIVNIICAVMLFQWKKIGFYGFIGTSLVAFGINLMIGLGVVQSIAGLVGIGILYAVFQIKGGNGYRAWDGLE